MLCTTVAISACGGCRARAKARQAGHMHYTTLQAHLAPSAAAGRLGLHGCCSKACIASCRRSRTGSSNGLSCEQLEVLAEQMEAGSSTGLRRQRLEVLAEQKVGVVVLRQFGGLHRQRVLPIRRIRHLPQLLQECHFIQALLIYCMMGVQHSAKLLQPVGSNTGCLCKGADLVHKVTRSSMSWMSC
jgi:hypothetical protein